MWHETEMIQTLPVPPLRAEREHFPPTFINAAHFAQSLEPKRMGRASGSCVWETLFIRCGS